MKMYTFSVPKFKNSHLHLHYQIIIIIAGSMKKVLFGFIALILFVLTGNAQEQNDFKCGSLITSFNKEVIKYNFKSIDDLKEQIEVIIKEFDFTTTENKKEICKITIELKLELTIGVTTLILSEIITTNCAEETKTLVTKRLKAMLLAAIG